MHCIRKWMPLRLSDQPEPHRRPVRRPIHECKWTRVTTIAILNHKSRRDQPPGRRGHRAISRRAKLICAQATRIVRINDSQKMRPSLALRQLSIPNSSLIYTSKTPLPGKSEQTMHLLPCIRNHLQSSDIEIHSTPHQTGLRARP